VATALELGVGVGVLAALELGEATVLKPGVAATLELEEPVQAAPTEPISVAARVSTVPLIITMKIGG
jgi:hypothetical protein